MARDRSKAIELIQKLHEITVENGATPAEAERAAGHAARLLAEYNLSLFDVTSQTFDESVLEEDRFCDSAVTHLWIRSLSGCIGRPLDCKIYVTKTWDRDAEKHKLKITFLGHKTDAEFAGYLWDMLSKALYAMATVSGKDAGRTSMALVAYRNQFIVHAAYQIEKRLDQEKENAETLHEAETGDKGTTTAMVLVKSTAISEYVEQKPAFAKATNMRPSSASRDDFKAQAAGYKAGKTIPIHKELEGVAAEESRLLPGV